MHRSFALLLIALVALVCIPAVWNKIMTNKILGQRNLTLQCFEDAQGLAIAVLEADSDRESKGLASVYPRDLGLTSRNAYFSYLQQQGILSTIPKTGSSMRIANLCRPDSEDMIFVTSIGTMRNIHTMIHNLGGYPNYEKGFISIKKNGSGKFFQSSVPLSATGQEPTNEPYYLE